MTPWAACGGFIDSHGRAAMVEIVRVEGSAPREVGTVMAVREDGVFSGTIGGGALEWQVLADARRLLASEQRLGESDYVLGPDLGQCCGGRVRVRIAIFDQHDQATIQQRAASASARHGQVAVFGAGHIGRALVLALAPLPFHVRWMDGRDGAFPSHVPEHTVCSRLGDIDTAVAAIAPGGLVVVMTHDHALDLHIVHRALSRPDLAFVGLIGSASKRARFCHRLTAAGLSPSQIGALTCPIGVGGLRSKSPAVIATGIALQLLQQHEARQAAVGDDGAASRMLPDFTLQVEHQS